MGKDNKSATDKSSDGDMKPPATPTSAEDKSVKVMTGKRSRDDVPTIKRSSSSASKSKSMGPPQTPVRPSTKNQSAEPEPHEDEQTSEVAAPPPDTQKPDPTAPIEDFDWHDLEERHYAQMQEFEAKEQAVYQDLHRLNIMFQTWAGAGQAKESERASKRLKTRIAFVQQRESDLAAKRLHYLHVVDAFQSALNLLGR